MPVAKTSTELCLATSPGVKDWFVINSIINLILGAQLCRAERACAGCDTGSCVSVRSMPRGVQAGQHPGTGTSREAEIPTGDLPQPETPLPVPP